MTVPTGIGCEIGGFAGDAIPAARLLAAASGCLITHPNVMNGAMLYWNDERIQYVEGYSLDQFAQGRIMLKPIRQQKIGILFDLGIEPHLYQRHLQVISACKYTLGLDIGPIIQTEQPLNITTYQSNTGISWGDIEEPSELLRAGEKLKNMGVGAIAVVTQFPSDIPNQSLDDYRKGKGVDFLAGIEAMISHLLVKHLNIPCAHAPAVEPLEIDVNIDPRAAAEELGYTFLPSVLNGLSRAPDLIDISELDKNSFYKYSKKSLISCEELGGIVVPDGALGGTAVLSCIEKGIPLIAVRNRSAINVGFRELGLDEGSKNCPQHKYISVNNYIEAAGIIISLREGINFDSLRI